MKQKRLNDMTTEKMNQGEYTKLNFPDAPAVLAARTAPASATAAAAAGGGAGIVPQKRAASKPVSTLMGAYYRESSNTWWSTLTLQITARDISGPTATQKMPRLRSRLPRVFKMRNYRSKRSLASCSGV